MDYYNHLSNANDINMILDTINEIFTKYYKNMFSSCHGRYHTMFVVDMVEHILKSLSYYARTIELGKVAALLHDTGMITGRWEHAKKSAVLSSVIFDGSDHLKPDEKKMLIQAIEDHSSGVDISSPVGAALIIADKADFSKRRTILPIDLLSDADKNGLEIDDVEIIISNDKIIINAVTTEMFNIELFIKNYTRYNLLAKAAKFLGCTCKFQINGKEVKW